MPQGQIVNQFYYRKILERLRKRVVRVRPRIANNWMLNHDNAPCHMAFSVTEFLAKKGIPVVRIPPGAWMSVCCECCVLSGRGLCDELITRPEESHRLWCVIVRDL